MKKNKYYILFLLAFVLFPFGAVAQQNIEVESFKKIPNDMDARIHFPVTDTGMLGGETCPLVKIVTTMQKKDCDFDGGTAGFYKVEQKVGEIWVYPAVGARYITIKHRLLGVLRNYEYPTGKLETATVYEMRLTTARITTRIEEELPQFGEIFSTPEGATVFINGENKGTTPLKNLSLLEGSHELKLTKPLYYDTETTFIVSAEEKFKVVENLRPKYGTISFESFPENGSEIYINEKLEGVTPTDIQLVGGEYTIRMRQPMYEESKVQKFSIAEGETKKISIPLTPLYSLIKINTAMEDAEIYVNQELKGKGVWEGRLLANVYTITVSKKGYYEEKRRLDVVKREDRAITIQLRPIVGTLAVITEPTDAIIYVDGKKIEEKTPHYIRNLAVGQHTVRLEKARHKTIEKTVTVAENKTVTLNETLQEGSDNKIFATTTNQTEDKTESEKYIEFSFSKNENIRYKNKYPNISTRNNIKDDLRKKKLPLGRYKILYKSNGDVQILDYKGFAGAGASFLSFFIPDLGLALVNGSRMGWINTFFIYGLYGTGYFFYASAQNNYNQYNQAMDPTQATNFSNTAEQELQTAQGLFIAGGIWHLLVVITAYIQGEDNKYYQRKFARNKRFSVGVFSGRNNSTLLGLNYKIYEKPKKK